MKTEIGSIELDNSSLLLYSISDSIYYANDPEAIEELKIALNAGKDATVWFNRGSVVVRFHQNTVSLTSMYRTTVMTYAELDQLIH